VHILCSQTLLKQLTETRSGFCPPFFSPTLFQVISIVIRLENHFCSLRQQWSWWFSFVSAKRKTLTIDKNLLRGVLITLGVNIARLGCSFLGVLIQYDVVILLKKCLWKNYCRTGHSLVCIALYCTYNGVYITWIFYEHWTLGQNWWLSTFWYSESYSSCI